jgi:bacterial type II and III secretion system protein
MKKIFMAVLILLAFQTLAFADSFKHSLVDFVAFASNQNKVDILISDEVNASSFYFFTESKNPKVSIDMLKNMLASQGLNLLKFDGYYFIDYFKNDKNILDIIDFNSGSKLFNVSLDNYVKDDVIEILKMYDVNATYLSTSNKVFFIAKDDNIREKVLGMLREVDETPRQSKVKITVLETNLKDVKDRGSEISAYAKSLPGSTFNYFFNLITMPYSATSNVTSSSKAGYYGVLRYLDSHQISDIKSSPFFTVRSGKEFYFSSVDNIPYLTQNREFTDDRQSVTSSYEYRDVGLKITVFPVILKDGSIDMNLHLVLEDIITNSNDKPTTSKKELKGSYLLKKGELLILSGINKKTAYDDHYSVPLLSDIWLIGNLFKLDSKSFKDTVLTVSIEIL